MSKLTVFFPCCQKFKDSSNGGNTFMLNALDTSEISNTVQAKQGLDLQSFHCSPSLLHIKDLSRRSERDCDLFHFYSLSAVHSYDLYHIHFTSQRFICSSQKRENIQGYIIKGHYGFCKITISSNTYYGFKILPFERD